jgi:Fe2+ or Zn2+ uptake regulation protein
VSSIYRNLVVLEQTGAVTRYPAAGGHARYELSEELVGHHHHLVCSSCGRMEDYEAPPEVEGGLQSVVDVVAARTGFRATGHRLELRGLCARCG